MPLTSSELTRRRKALTNDFDRRNNQWLGANTGPTSTAFEARMVSEATGAKIASARSTEGGAWTSIPLTALQDFISSVGSNPTLSDLVKATNINSMIEQGPYANIGVFQLPGGGIACYSPTGVFLGAVNAAGNPIPLPDNLKPDLTWMATINDTLGTSDTMRSFATDGSGGIYILGSYTGPSTVNDAGVAAPTPSALTLGAVPDSATDSGLYIVKYNLSGVALWATQIHVLGLQNPQPIRLVCDGTRVFISSFCKTYANFYNGVTSGTPSASTQLNLAIAGSPIYNTFIASYACSTGAFNWAAPLTSVPGGPSPSYFTGGITVRGSALVYSSVYKGTVSVYDATANGTVGSAIQTYTQGGTGQNMVIVSFNNATGAIVFSTQIATVAVNTSVMQSSPRANVIDSTGNIYVCAIIGTATSLTIYNANGRGTPSVTTTYTRISPEVNLCLIKFNSSGALQWVAPIIGSSQQTCTNLLCTTTDDIIIPFTISGASAQVMYSTSSTSTGIATVAGTGTGATHLAKYSSAGVAQWITKLENTVSYGSNGPGICSLDSSDNIYICGGYGPTIIPYSWTGTVGSAGNPTSTGINITGSGQYVMKYTTNGAFISAGKVSSIFVQCLSILNISGTTYVIGALAGETLFYGFSSGDPSTFIYSITTSDQVGFLINYL